MSEIIDTIKAAEILNMSPTALSQFLYRNPEFKPAIQVGPAYIWTEAEIEAIRLKRIELRSRKPKTQQTT